MIRKKMIRGPSKRMSKKKYMSKLKDSTITSTSFILLGIINHFSHEWVRNMDYFTGIGRP